MCQGGGGDHQVHGVASTGFTTRTLNDCVDLAVGSGAARIEGERLKACLNLLQVQLTTSSRQLIRRRVRPPAQLRERKGRYRDLSWEFRGIDRTKVNRNRGIDQSPIVNQPSSEA